MRFSKVVSPAFALLAGSAMVAGVAAASPKLTPGIFNDTTLPNAAVAVASWEKGAGIDGSDGLVLAKITPTDQPVAAQAEFSGFEGKPANTLGFTVRDDVDCGGGSPRFNLYTEEAGDTPYFFGCDSPGATGMTTVDTFTDKEGVAWSVKEANLTDAGADGETVTAVEIVVDERGDQGSTILDDIVVNNQTFSKGSKKGK